MPSGANKPAGLLSHYRPKHQLAANLRDLPQNLKGIIVLYDKRYTIVTKKGFLIWNALSFFIVFRYLPVITL
jgi:hypothetical protein